MFFSNFFIIKSSLPKFYITYAKYKIKHILFVYFYRLERYFFKFFKLKLKFLATCIILKQKLRGFHYWNQHTITQRNKIELSVSCIHFDNCSWLKWGHGFQILHYFYCIRSTFFATAYFWFTTINYAKHYTGQQNQYFPLLQKLFKLFLTNFWALILNLCTFYCKN